MSLHRIKFLDLWPSLRAFLENHKNLLTGSNKRVLVEDYGRVTIVVDVEIQQIIWLKQKMNQYEAPVIQSAISYLGPIRWVGWSENTIFVLLADKQMNLVCWDPQLNRNPMIDENENTSMAYESYVRSYVHKVAFGSAHVLMLCDDIVDDQRRERQLIAVYSWSEANLLGDKLKGQPTRMEMRFSVPLVDIACTWVDGSVVLDSQDNVHLWGSFNGRMVRYVFERFMIPINEKGPMKQCYVTAKNLVFLNDQGRVFYMNYEHDYFGPIRILPTEEFIEEIFTSSKSSVAILLGVNGRMYVWDCTDCDGCTLRVYPLSFPYIPDAYCLHVNHSTPELATLSLENYDEQRRKFEGFNDMLDSCFSLLINHQLAIWIHRKDLTLRLKNHSQYFQRIPIRPRQPGFWDNYGQIIETLCYFLDQYSTPVSYAFLYYLYTGEVNTDNSHLNELEKMAKQLQCWQMIPLIEQKVKQSATTLMNQTSSPQSQPLSKHQKQFKQNLSILKIKNNQF